MNVSEKLFEFAELRGWNKSKLIGWSEAADFGGWLVTEQPTPPPQIDYNFIIVTVWIKRLNNGKIRHQLKVHEILAHSEAEAIGRALVKCNRELTTKNGTMSYLLGPWQIFINNETPTP